MSAIGMCVVIFFASNGAPTFEGPMTCDKAIEINEANHTVNTANEWHPSEIYKLAAAQ